MKCRDFLTDANRRVSFEVRTEEGSKLPTSLLDTVSLHGAAGWARHKSAFLELLT